MEFNFNGNTYSSSKYDDQSGRRFKKERKAVTSKTGRFFISILVTLLFAAVYFYVKVPAINMQCFAFYWYIFLCCAVYCLCAVITSAFHCDGPKGYFTFLKKQATIPLFICILMVAIVIAGSVAGWKLFRANDYKDLITIENGDFAEEIEEISFDQIPMLDSASARRLGNRKLGELSDMVSQFEVADDYTQINYNDQPVRVTPLQYGDIIKWLNNRSEGLPAYLIIDMVTQNVDVVRLQEGIKYTTAEHFNRNLYRYLRFQYPTYMFDDPAFEIDEQGNPYWVCPRIVKTIGLFKGTDITGAVLVNAVTGETEYYEVEDVPTWVDHVFTADLIIQQYDYHGTFINGFWNSIFGQRDVTVTTDGYNYIAIDDDVYMYTGITSVVSDESNIGFILSNQRTKETRFYTCAGAEEFSAMGSAEGQVQQMSYEATFPLLLNISEQPTYFMALKDNAGLVKMYAMVNVAQYQIVATGSTVEECETNYRQMLLNNKLVSEEEAVVLPEQQNSSTAQGVVSQVRTMVVDGNTVFFFEIESEGESTYYTCLGKDAEEAVLISEQDSVEIRYNPETQGIALELYEIHKID